MDLYRRQSSNPGPLQGFVQNCTLHLHLRGVRGVLEVAPSAFSEMCAWWRHAFFGDGQNLDKRRLAEGATLFHEMGLDKLLRQCKRNKDRSTRAFTLGLMSET